MKSQTQHIGNYSNVFDYSPFGAPLDGRTVENIFSQPKADTIIVADTLFIINNDFENAVIEPNGAGVKIDGWTHYSPSTTLSVEPHNGSDWLKVVSTNGTHGAHQGFSVEPGESYTFEIDLHRPAGFNLPINVVIWKNSGPSGALSVHVLNVDGTNTFTYNATSSEIFVQIRQAGTYYLDNIRMYRTYEDTMFVSGYEVDMAYRYGYNSQERDNEVSGEGNSYTAEFWQYDPRSGRRWNIDPKPNPAISPYATFSNNPIFNSDPYGDTIVNKEVTDKVIKQIDVIINKAENTIAENKMKLDELKRRGSLSNEEKEKVNTLINENSIANTIVMNLNKLKENISDLDKDENLYEFKRINNLNPATLKPDLIELNETAQKLSDGRLHITIPYVNTEFLSSTIHGIKHGAQIVSGFLVPYFENGSNYTERFEGNHTAAELEAYKTQYLAVPNSLPYSTTQKVNSIWDINENWLRGIFNSEGVQVYR